jgi:uncharacterized DUF497 family protein
MKIVFDETKRAANLDKHALDMADFEDGFDFATAAQFSTRASRTGIERYGLIAA